MSKKSMWQAAQLTRQRDEEMRKKLQADIVEDRRCELVRGDKISKAIRLTRETDEKIFYGGK